MASSSSNPTTPSTILSLSLSCCECAMAEVSPDHFQCPLTLEIMTDPLWSKHGYTFERKAILEWLTQNDSCPITRKFLTPSLLISNTSLRLRIQAWKGFGAAGYICSCSTSVEDPNVQHRFVTPSSSANDRYDDLCDTYQPLIVLDNEAAIQTIRRQAWSDIQSLQ